MQQLLGAACAVGVSASFGATVGGVLFSIEVRRRRRKRREEEGGGRRRLMLDIGDISVLSGGNVVERVLCGDVRRIVDLCHGSSGSL